MTHSLQEQLLKTGLISEKKAKKVDQQIKLKRHQQQKKKKKKRGKVIEKDSPAYLAIKTREEEIARAKELNRQKEAERQEKALYAQVRDLIQHHQVNDPKADISYHFIEDQQVKQISVTPTQQKQLANGHLAITVLDTFYSLVPAPIARKLQERVPEVVVHFEKSEEKEVDLEDPYVDYLVPDDLMW